MEMQRGDEAHTHEDQYEQDDRGQDPARRPESAEETERDPAKNLCKQADVHQGEGGRGEVQKRAGSLQALLLAETVGTRRRTAVGEHVKEAEEDVDEENGPVKNEHGCLLWQKRAG